MHAGDCLPLLEMYEAFVALPVELYRVLHRLRSGVDKGDMSVQVPVPADQKISLQGADDRVLEEAVLPNGAILQLSLTCRSENLL